ncbi:S8 family serine peptidase [Actinophytocola xanthii]|uniref:Peptidase S8/S53 domain-containing protein n=1 Tax=Actinophytocola xanthii TaxID=1912961 RepID=A0A1Q8CTD3_9PSEU|nr:S8 family serine peptidase [Actinophytocola xanthii]OLF17628.1 hypothetical protein BU204_10450 [Actinophytocola xanthii]
MRALLVFGALAGILVAATPTPVAAQPPEVDQEPVGQCTPPSNTPVRQLSWAQRRMSPERVWPLTGGDVLVGVVDTGVSAQAPALAGAVLPGTDLTGGPGDGDCFGRGTFLASLIAARPSANPDVPFVGLAPAARIFPVRVSDDPPKIRDHAALAVAIGNGIRAAVDAGARVVAVGLVATIGVRELDDAVAYAADRDVLVVASAAVPRNGQLAFPARVPGVLAVAPVGPDGPVRNPVYGAAPQLAAPADELIGVAPRGNGHRLASSSELAVAFVAGAAALVRDYHPTLSAPEVAARLRDTADQPSTSLPNKLVGYGIVNPFAAVTVVPNTDSPATPPAELRVEVPRHATPDPVPISRALWFAGGIAAAALLVTGPAVAVAARRRRAP